MRTAITLSLTLLLASVSAVALEWEELAAFAAATKDVSGRPAVVFSVQLEYDQRPSDADLSFGWTIWRLDSGDKIELHSFYRSTTFTGGGLRISFASARVPIEAGERYRGRVVVDDSVNDLHYERDIDYTAPVSLRVGIILRGVTGSDEVDLSSADDEEIEEMATAYDALRADYSEIAEGVSLDEFFSQHAADDEAFPATVFIIPVQGTESPLGSATGPVAFTVTPVMYVFPVPERSAVRGLLEQLRVYEREFVGLVFEGDGHDALFGARTVFVGEEAWRILAAAAAEEGRRLTP